MYTQVDGALLKAYVQRNVSYYLSNQFKSFNNCYPACFLCDYLLFKCFFVWFCLPTEPYLHGIKKHYSV